MAGRATREGPRSTGGDTLSTSQENRVEQPEDEYLAEIAHGLTIKRSGYDDGPRPRWSGRGSCRCGWVSRDYSGTSGFVSRSVSEEYVGHLHAEQTKQ